MTEQKKRRILVAEYSSVQMFYWMGWCCIGSYAAVFLQSRGYTNTQLGTMIALGNIGGFLLSPVLAAIVDRSERISVYHCLAGLLLAEGALEGLLLVNPGSTLLVSVLFCLLYACAVAVSPLNTQLCFELDHMGRYISYGFSRSTGSFAYSIICILLGRLIARRSPELLSIAGILLISLQLAALVVIVRLRARVDPPDCSGAVEPPHKSALSLSAFLVENRRFALFCFGTALLNFAGTISGSFLINKVRLVGGGASDLGNLNSFASLLEVPVMLLYTRITRNIHCSKALRFAAVMYVVRAVCYALSGSMTALYATTLLQSSTYALISPALVDYAGLVVSYRDSAKAQAVSSAMFTLGACLAGQIGGILYDRISVNATLLVGAGVCAIGALICFLAVDKKRA